VESYITDAFVKEGSLKMQKAELDRLRKEAEEEERLRLEKAESKRARSGKKVITTPQTAIVLLKSPCRQQRW